MLSIHHNFVYLIGGANIKYDRNALALLKAQ